MVDNLTRLAKQARRGDKAALEAFVNTAYPQVWKLCSRLVDRRAADDLAQETFLHAVRALPRFRGDSSGRTWILAIARNVCIDELRSLGRRRNAVWLSPPAEEQVTAVEPSHHAVVTDLLGQLEPERRTAFVLTQLLGLSYREAAVVDGCPVGTIRSRVARARDDLAEFLRSADPTERQSR